MATRTIARRLPDSALPVSWRVHREVVVLLGWGRAILLQLAHPLVARGVADHSRFRDVGLGRLRRLHRTLGAMLTLTFGTAEEAAAVVRRINGIHDRVQGRLPGGAGRFPVGTTYSAHDPALLRWVHATCVDSFLLAYERFVAPLAPGERDAYCAESAEIEGPLGMPAGVLPRTHAALSGYVDAMLTSDEIRVTDVARELAEGIVHPPLGRLSGPAVLALRLATVGLLPASVRDAYGFAWSARRERALGVLARSVRGVLPFTPSVLREWPVARRAQRRAAA